MGNPLRRVALRNWSLRIRLILATLSLAAIAIVASDFAASSSLKTFLLDQVDSQLETVATNSIERLDRAGIDPNGDGVRGDHQDDQPFTPVRPLNNVPTAITVTLLDLSGNVVGQVGGDLTTEDGTSPFVGLQPAEVVSYQGLPFTIKGGDGAPDIRVIARLLPSGVGTAVVSVTLDSVDRTLAKLFAIFLLISFIVLFIIGIVSYLLIRLSLRPLTAIEGTAQAIADGDLSARLSESNPKTEVGRLTNSLNRMLARIEESFAVRVESETKLRRFVADASHELRTPLTAIRGFAELHRQGAVQGEEKTKELVGRIEKESIRMSSLVEDLLLLARLDQSRQLDRDPVDIEHLISEAVASAEAAGPAHPITVKIEDEDLFVLGDSMRIHQAIANLLANARTHTEDGTPITITAKHLDHEITVAVSDQGGGLSPADQEKIFERFYRADPSRVRVRGEGSGLGLSIVHAVMQAHGGSVTVESELGKGSTFTLHFPIVD